MYVINAVRVNTRRRRRRVLPGWHLSCTPANNSMVSYSYQEKVHTPIVYVLIFDKTPWRQRDFQSKLTRVNKLDTRLCQHSMSHTYIAMLHDENSNLHPNVQCISYHYVFAWYYYAGHSYYKLLNTITSIMCMHLVIWNLIATDKTKPGYWHQKYNFQRNCLSVSSVKKQHINYMQMKYIIQTFEMSCITKQ